MSIDIWNMGLEKVRWVSSSRMICFPLVYNGVTQKKEHTFAGQWQQIGFLLLVYGNRSALRHMPPYRRAKDDNAYKSGI